MPLPMRSPHVLVHDLGHHALSEQGFGMLLIKDFVGKTFRYSLSKDLGKTLRCSLSKDFVREKLAGAYYAKIWVKLLVAHRARTL